MINGNIAKENKMGVLPVGKLLVQMSLPMMISMLVQALYNIVDSIFVARLGEAALTAVSLAFPVQNLMIAVATGTGVGINALLSMRLGQKKQNDVNLTAINGIFLSFCSCVVFVLLGLFLTPFYFMTQTSDPSIIEYGVQYLEICTVGSLGFFVSITFERLLQSTGRTLLSMYSQLLGAITNIIFDPLLIFGLAGFPELGMRGAAIATVMGQFAAAILSLILNVKKNHDIQFKFRKFRPNGIVIRDIYKVGVPSILLASIGSIMTYGMNIILGVFTSTAVAVFGVYFKLQSFIFMPVFGLNNGIVPIISYNYGAQRRKRITGTIKLAAMAALIIMIIGSFLFWIIPRQLLSLFNASEDMYSIGIKALRIIALHFPVAALCITMMSIFQSLGQGVYSMVCSFIRQLIVLLPVAWLLSLSGDVNAIWWAFPIAEIASLVTSSVLMVRLYKSKLKNLPD